MRKESKQEKKPFEFKDETETKHIKVSKTDQESGYYHRDNKEKGFYVSRKWKMQYNN